MKILLTLLISCMVISSGHASITVRNDTDYKISGSWFKTYKSSGNRLSKKGLNFELQPQESRNFKDPKFFRGYTLSAHIDDHREIKKDAFKIEDARYAQLVAKPKHNLIVPITIEKSLHAEDATKKILINIPRTRDELYETLEIGARKTRS